MRIRLPATRSPARVDPRSRGSAMIDNPGETIAGFRTCLALSRFARNRRDPRQKSWKRSHGRSGSGGRGNRGRDGRAERGRAWRQNPGSGTGRGRKQAMIARDGSRRGGRMRVSATPRRCGQRANARMAARPSCRPARWAGSKGRRKDDRAGASEASTRPGEAVQAEGTEAAMVARSAAEPGGRSREAELIAVERRR